jgi:hypothetical protein
MGWCSATEIMDWAIQMTDLAVEEALGDAPDDETQARVEDRIRSRVACLARKLHDEDWDCEQDSDYFWRFPQEMLGYDDREYAAWLGDLLQGETNPERVADIAARLAEVSKAVSGGR